MNHALVCHQHGKPEEVVVLKEVPDAPTPGPGDIKVEVHYASLSHSTRLLIEGKYQSKPPMPFTPGTEAVGVVLQVGPGEDRLKPGDPVLLISRWGCFAKQMTLPGHTVYPIPSGLGMLSALPLGISYGTAYTGLLWRTELKPGETVLVLGAGAGVGLAAVELASLMGAEVIACASSEDKRQAALKHGAAHTVAPNEDLGDRIKSLTQGRGVDVVVDPVGGDIFGQVVRACARNARILTLGFASGKIPAVPLNHILVKNITIHGFVFGRYIGWNPDDERAVFAPALQDVMANLMRWASQGRIHPEVAKVFPMDQLIDAMDLLESRTIVGKLALNIKGDTR